MSEIAKSLETGFWLAFVAFLIYMWAKYSE